MSEIRDNFIQSMDESTSGIHALMAQTFTLLKVLILSHAPKYPPLETRLLRLASPQRPGDPPAVLPVSLDDASFIPRNENSRYDTPLGLAFQ